TGDYSRYAGAGMFHTTDAGQTWMTVPLPVNPTNFFQVLYLPNDLNIMLASSDAGLLRSTNGANGPWEVVLTGLVTDLAIHPTNPNIQYASRTTAAGISGGIYQSSDFGQSWPALPLTTGAPANAFGISRIAISRNFPDNVAFVYEWGCNIQGVF